MVEHVRVFLDGDALTELEDLYVGNESDLRKAIQKFITNIYKGTKQSQITKTLYCNIESDGENGQRVTKLTPIPYKEVDFTKYVVKHNPNWKPKGIDDVKYYELAVGEATWKKLQDFAIQFMAIVDKYNESLFPDKKDLLEYQETLTTTDKTIKAKLAPIPECFEHIIQEHLAGPVMELINSKLGKICEDEFAELEKKEETAN